jgi:hypothetical protein
MDISKNHPFIIISARKKRATPSVTRGRENERLHLHRLASEPTYSTRPPSIQVGLRSKTNNNKKENLRLHGTEELISQLIILSSRLP